MNHTLLHTRRLFLVVSWVALTTGCAVGPDFVRPAAPDIDSYDETALPQPSPESTQFFALDKDIPAAWWTLFHSEPLNQLIEQALKANPDLAAADASLHVAEENLLAGEGSLFPNVGASFTSTRQKTANTESASPVPGTSYTLLNASVNVSYNLDLFGGTRRGIEELDALVDLQKFQREAAVLSLTGNVVTASIQEASLRGQIAATRKRIDDQTKLYNLLQKQMALGGAALPAVLTQETLLAQTKATLPDLERRLSATRHELSALVGQMPNQTPHAFFDLGSLKLPKELPVTLPSKLVEQRPDIRAAEANLHAASAAIGVAEAARFPQVTLSGNMGSMADEFKDLFTPGFGVWGLGASITQPIFDAGQLGHKQSAAEATLDLAAAHYRKTVLTGFQDVADTLRALQADAETLKAQTSAAQIATENLNLAQQQFSLGAVAFSTVLDAEQLQQQTEISRLQAEAQGFADTAALFQSLGGGWWNRTAIAENKTTILSGFLLP